MIKHQLVTGENCSTCLQLYIDPSASEYCVGSVINVTVFTNQSYSLDDTITLMVNDRVCNGNNSDNDVVECDKSDDTIIHHFILTAINSGTVIIRAHTNYHGADWYSDSENVTIVEDCSESM